ncbi:hypothetical protein HQ531_12180 [bacterium]|nr:hypothetical protein [bacterium]
MEKENLGMTPKTLMEVTGISLNQLVYLRRMNRLPILKQSPGPGYPTIYDPKSVDIIRTHLKKGSIDES